MKDYEKDKIAKEISVYDTYKQHYEQCLKEKEWLNYG